MIDNLRPVWAEINLNNFIHNIKAIRDLLPHDVCFLGVVKANAYGHGALKISEIALEFGVDKLATATLDEALAIKQRLPKAEILVLGYTSPKLIYEAIINDITLCVYHEEVAKAINKIAYSLNKIAKIHIKLDTGMGRIGYQYTQKSINEIIQINNFTNVEIEGIFTHFATASDNKDFLELQNKRFNDFINELQNLGVCPKYYHCANSAAILEYPHTYFNMVRAGIILYGISDNHNPSNIILKPVMSLKTKVVHLKTIQKGDSVSYGRTFIATKDTIIATLPLGYADGYMRILSNKAEVLINGKRAKIVGNICMDQCMIDVSEIDNVELGSEVILLGSDNFGGEISASELADIAGTINYEIICAISNRVPRVYIYNL